MPHFFQLYLNHRDKPNLVFLSVNVNSVPSARSKARLYFRRMGWDLPLYFDQDDKVADFFKYKDNPATFIIEPGLKISFQNEKHYNEKKYLKIIGKRLKNF
ncbi:peroxiredoxin family protein [candidate division KSB1 bacterium]|nr:peroxiredoxin family protein [candidate division KSB1 bacterium]